MRYFFTLLYCLIITITGKSQVPIFVNNQYNLNTINPAYTGKSNLRELSLLSTYSYISLSRSDGFKLKERYTPKIIADPNFTNNSNYNNINISSPIYLKKKKALGLGISYFNNDLNPLETANTFLLSFAISSKLKSNGSFHLGLNFKRNTMKFTSNRIYFQFEQSGYDVFINDYKETRGNFDLGILYVNDSATFDFGLSILNCRPWTYGINTLDDKFQLIYSSNPIYTLVSNFKQKISPRAQIEYHLSSSIQKISSQSFVCFRSIFKLNKWGIGFQYSKFSSFTIGPQVKFENKYLGISYGYDLIPTRLLTTTSGFHSLNLLFRFK